MTRKEIGSDPWKARSRVCESLGEITEEIENIYISEDGMEEDKEYRKEIVDQLSTAFRLVEKLKEKLA